MTSFWPMSLASRADEMGVGVGGAALWGAVAEAEALGEAETVGARLGDSTPVGELDGDMAAIDGEGDGPGVVTARTTRKPTMTATTRTTAIPIRAPLTGAFYAACLGGPAGDERDRPTAPRRPPRRGARRRPPDPGCRHRAPRRWRSLLPSQRPRHRRDSTRRPSRVPARRRTHRHCRPDRHLGRPPS